jgi:cystathionine gamma-synthase
MNSFCAELGSILPENDAHGVSISLPTWSAVVGYEQGDPAILTKLKSGYPRFRFHQSLEKLMNVLLYIYYLEDARDDDSVISSGSVGSFENPPKRVASIEILVFPSVAVAERFASFLVRGNSPFFLLQGYRSAFVD